MADKRGVAMTKSLLVPIADGTEELEAVTIIDVLRRAGATVTVAAVESCDQLQICGSRETKIVADCSLQDCAQNSPAQPWDLIAVPGGLPGAEHLAASAILDKLLRQQVAEGRLFAAICAAPCLVLGAKGLLRNSVATCHPMYHQQLEAREVDTESRVVVDGNCITSQGPGTALDFALELVEQLFGVVKREEVAAPMVMTTSATSYY
jgi:4-methyl-5(b-hydroxyethyl)-thiazole monophosphate biosynthesis